MAIETPSKRVTIIGAGLAGSECAYQLAKRGVPVLLLEQKPSKKTRSSLSVEKQGVGNRRNSRSLHWQQGMEREV